MKFIFINVFLPFKIKIQDAISHQKMGKTRDLNANGTLFGGKMLVWIDEEAAFVLIVQLENSM